MHDIFDKKLVKLHRDRSVKYANQDCFFLVRTAETDIAERLENINQEYSRTLILGARDQKIASTLPKSEFYFCDSSNKFMDLYNAENKIICDEEFLPLKEEFFDLIVSPVTLQFCNDIPGILMQLRKALKNNGITSINIFSGDSLLELRNSLLFAEEKQNGVSPRISPSMDIKSFGMLFKRTGYNNIVCDSQTITVGYDNIISIMHDLRRNGLANALKVRGKPLTRTILESAEAYYRDNFSDDNGNLLVTFELITCFATKL